MNHQKTNSRGFNAIHRSKSLAAFSWSLPLIAMPDGQVATPDGATSDIEVKISCSDGFSLQHWKWVLQHWSHFRHRKRLYQYLC